MAPPAPNIVLIFVDNQPAGMLGCAGNREIHTPHLDGLAARNDGRRRVGDCRDVLALVP